MTVHIIVVGVGLFHFAVLCTMYFECTAVISFKTTNQ